MEETDETVTSMYNLFIKNMDQIKKLDETSEDIDVSDNFRRLYKMCKEGNNKEFNTLSKTATRDELSICLCVADKLSIIRCIVEDCKVFDGIIECYKDAVLYDRIDIIEYIEEKHTKYVLDLIDSVSERSEHYSDEEDEDDS